MNIRKLLSALLVVCLLLSPVAVMEDDMVFEAVEETVAEPVVEDEVVEGEAEEVAAEPAEEVEVVAEAVDEIVEEEELGEEDDFALEEISEEDEFELTDEEEEAEPELMAAEAEGVAIDENNFPDENFRDVLAWSEYDRNSDGILSASEINSITRLDLGWRDISDLTGIEYFTNLTYLSLEYNYSLTKLDLSANAALQKLYCERCALEELNVSNCPDLQYLDCAYNHLPSLNVSNNTQLAHLYCHGNQLTALDVSSCPSLIECLDYPGTCSYGELEFSIYDNEGDYIAILCVDAGVTLNPTPKVKDENKVSIDAAHFPDANFRQYVLNRFDADHNNWLSTYEINGATYISLWGTDWIYDDETGEYTEVKKTYSNVKGIEYLSNLRDIDIYNSGLTSLDVSKNKNLEYIWCYDNQITSLDVSNLPSLYSLNVGRNQLKTLNASNNPNLERIDCRDNALTSLNVNKDSNLTQILCDGNKLTNLDITDCPIILSHINQKYYKLNGNVAVYQEYVIGTGDDSDYTVTYLTCDASVKILTTKATPTPKATVKPTPTPTPKPTPTPMPVIKVAKKNVKATVNVGTQYKIDLNGAVAKSFKSSKKKVATVDSNGVLTPKAKGKAKITIKIGKKKRTLTLTVKDPTIPNKVTLNMAGTVAAKKGTSVTLTATLPAGTNSGIKWKSSNKKIATVKNGVVTFKKKGKVTITATATRGKKKAKVKFKVTN